MCDYNFAGAVLLWWDLPFLHFYRKIDICISGPVSDVVDISCYRNLLKIPETVPGLTKKDMARWSGNLSKVPFEKEMKVIEWKKTTCVL